MDGGDGGGVRDVSARGGGVRRARAVAVGVVRGGGVDARARAVADAANASVCVLGEDEIVDFGERFRGSLAFASPSGRDRIEIHGVRATRLERRLMNEGADADDDEDDDEDEESEDDEDVREMEATRSIAGAGARDDVETTPLACALRVVEIVRARDVPSVYLSSTPALRVRIDDVPQSRAVRQALFSSWSAAFAEAATPGDVPALVVKSQWLLSGTKNSKRQYRDFLDEDGATPMLLYPVRLRGGDRLAFNLRAFVTLPELLRRLSAGVGSTGMNKLNVAIDNMSKLARENALEEADRALTMLSDRQSVKIDDVMWNTDDGTDGKDDADENAYHDAEPNMPKADAAFSPDIGIVKNSKILSAVAAASRGATKASGGEGDAHCADYFRLWEAHEKYNHDPAFQVPKCGARGAEERASNPCNRLRFDDIVDRLMDVNESNALEVDRRGGQDGVEGFYTETFSKSIDVAMAHLDENVVAMTTLRNIGGIAKHPESVSAREKSFLQLMGETDEDARNQRRTEHMQRIEERREKVFLSLGMAPSSKPDVRREIQTRRESQSLAFDAAATPKCPNSACGIELKRGAGQTLKFCYECGVKL